MLTSWFEEEIEPLLSRQRNLAEVSLRRKMAHLRESAIATLQTMLARTVRKEEGGRRKDESRQRPSSDSSFLLPPSSFEVPQLLDEADLAIRRARERTTNWRDDTPALLDILLSDAAQAVVSPANNETAVEGPVLSALNQVLVQRDQMACELLRQLHQALLRILSSLQRVVSRTQADTTALQAQDIRGLPVLQDPPQQLTLQARRPWWAPVLPRMAVWVTRRDLQHRLGPLLREQVLLHERQLQTWLKTSLGQLVELYETQAEVFRDQCRRVADSTAGVGAASDRESLEADLRELQADVPVAI